MTKRRRFRLRRCIYCGEWYQPNPRAAARQKYCGDPECQKARRRKTAKTWRRYNHLETADAVSTHKKCHPRVQEERAGQE